MNHRSKTRGVENSVLPAIRAILPLLVGPAAGTMDRPRPATAPPLLSASALLAAGWSPRLDEALTARSRSRAGRAEDGTRAGRDLPVGSVTAVLSKSVGGGTPGRSSRAEFVLRP